MRLNLPGLSHGRKLKIIEKPTDHNIFIGVSVPGIRPARDGSTDEDPTSYGMRSNGVVQAGPICLTKKLPTPAITQRDVCDKRDTKDKVFSAGDEVSVTLDCVAHTLRLQSPTINYLINIQRARESQQTQLWVLNVTLNKGDHKIQLLG